MAVSRPPTKGTRVSLLLKWGKELLAELGMPSRQDLTDQIALVTTRLETFMADVSPLLNKLATDLDEFAAGPFAAVLAENAQLKVDKQTLLELVDSDAAARAVEDAAEETAAARAVSSFNNLAAPLTQSPDVPVEVPVVEEPPAPEPSPELPTELPADPGTGEDVPNV